MRLLLRSRSHELSHFTINIQRYIYSSPGGSEADIVRKHGGAVNIVVAVNSVGAVEQWNPEARPKRGLLESVDHVHPIRRRRFLERSAAASAENAPCNVKTFRTIQTTCKYICGHVKVESERETYGEVTDGVRRGDATVDLSHLADLLLQGHSR